MKILFRLFVLVATLSASPAFSQDDCYFSYEYMNSEMNALFDALVADPDWNLVSMSDGQTEMTLSDRSGNHVVIATVEACSFYTVAVEIRLSERRSDAMWKNNLPLFDKLLTALKEDDALDALEHPESVEADMIYIADYDHSLLEFHIAYEEPPAGGSIVTLFKMLKPI